ncbi:beta-galactosidase trimerization domain-containing protein [Cohnella zeiphila]|uniref:Beta-galactosidase trimerization domain-containing protein n=1 Tax=Cohnella zeiphila TaxID=2761120 RepID=A0A7X0SQL4_9BACL|nr:beta-galactosidase trimerization domain-containing protein [Cohnella zeiphila]MBB6734322.1 beta-galactosidase trimerization domain-containing protein [Cohnella zeiphila]
MTTATSWHERPLRIVDFIPPAPDRYEALDMAEQAAVRSELGFNAEHIEVHDVSLGESGITFYPSEFAVENRKDLLTEIASRNGASGVKTIVYFNVHWLSPSLSEVKPEWLQRDSAGEVIPSAYGQGGYSCINSPFREYAFGTIRTLAKHRIDGIFLDGPIFREDGCYCEACRQQFQDEYGYEPPVGAAIASREDHDWFGFRRSSIARFMREARQALQETNPGAIIYMNSPQLAPNRLCCRDNRMTVAHQDMLLAEGGFLGGDLRTVPVWKPAATAMLLETQAGGKPYCVAIAGRLSPWSRYLLTAAETWIAHAMAVAHGAWTWYGVYNDNNKDARMRTVREINDFLAAHEEHYTGTRSAARVALLWSYATANYYQTTAEATDFTDAKSRLRHLDRNDSRQAFNGWFDALSRSRVPFDVIDDTALTDGTLGGYELLVLPGASCMAAADAEAVRRFVKAGGRLIATFDTSFYDEYGHRLDEPSLADVLGVRQVRGTRVNAFDHIAVEAGQDLFAEIDQTLVPSALLGVECSVREGADVSGFYRERQLSRYSELPDATSSPYIVRHAYGQGSCIYFTGNVDGFYSAYALPEYRTLLANAVREMIEPELECGFETDVASVHVSLRIKGDSLLIHLVNYTGSMTRPMSSVLPLRNVRIRLRERDGWSGECTIRSLRGNRTLAGERSEGTLSFVLPVLHEYEAIVIAND